MSERRIKEARTLRKACRKKTVGEENRRGQEINENFKRGVVAVKKGKWLCDLVV